MQKFNPQTRFAAALDLDVKADNEGVLTGYASLFDVVDRQSEIVRPGAYRRTLAEHKMQGTSPALLWSHKLDRPIGRWVELREDQRGLWAKGKLSLNTDAGKQAYAHLVNGDLDGLSIGFVVPEDGRKYLGDGTFELLEIELVEISVVTAPANQGARISSVKALSTKSEFVDLFRASGLSKATARRAAAGAWRALQDDDTHENAKALISAIEAATALIRSK
ncbi:phage prohead protease protein [Sinorhizobium fredii]|uniref:Phage prohead protease protein n=2 Tax=Rhizobium fredii TaxID=380 RepID=A0A2L0H9Z2_RHIFR|nr:phage prohead protease protein [Sinorhizobium fredii]